MVLRDIFTPLVSGATLCIPDDPDDIGGDNILPWLQSEKISVIHLTPTVAQSWLSSNKTPFPLPHLRAVFFAGESLTGSLIKQWKYTFPGTPQIINLYGPTETTLAKCFYALPENGDKLPPILPVGRPLTFTQALVIREGTKLCGSNEIGEVVLRTPYKSKGYLNQKALAGKGFTQNFFRADDEQDEIYWTGDLGRYQSDGSLEIIGRVDEQIKIRGVRIQPEEIISNLLDHPAVDSCTVTVQKISQRKILAAYIVSSKNAGASAGDLRVYLSQLLPSAFIPDIFVFLDALPITPTGKIDKRSLPPITQEEIENREAMVSPRNETEEKLLEIWQRELGMKQIGIYNNFFELGGHSLLAMKMMGEIRQVFNLNLPLRVIFEAPTIAEFALSVSRRLTDKEEPAMRRIAPIKIDRENRYEPFPLTNIQQAYWIGRTGNFDLGQVATHNYSEYQFENLDVERFNKAFQKLIERHDALRLIITPDGQQRILKEVPDFKIPFRNLSHLDEKEKEDALRIVRENLSHKVHALEEYPLFDTSISRLTEETYIVHISIDALICDAWSRRLLGKELLQIYNSSKILPTLDISFRDYVLQEYELQNSDEYLKCKNYWMDKLENLPPAPQLPLIKDPSLLEQTRFVRWRRKLSPDLWKKLKARAARAGLTPSGLICAVYAEILGFWSKNQRFTINLTLFNRRQAHPQINNIVGDFTSLILLSIENMPQATFEERAKRIQKELFNALDNALFSGVEVLRELNRRAGGRTNALMPVVLTSTLFKSSEDDELIDVWQREMVYGISQTPQVYLDHGVSEQNGALIFGWDAIPDLFEAGVVEEMFAAYTSLLEALAGEEQAWQAVSRRRLLPAAQQARRRAYHLGAEAEAVAVAEAVASAPYLHTPVFLQGVARPQAAAVLSERRELSFEQLCGEAFLLAESLRGADGGVKGETVGIVMEKGWEQAVAALAILQAGGAYLPVDSRLPAARQVYLLANAGVKRIVTQPWLKAELGMRETADGKLAGIGESVLTDALEVWEVVAEAAAEKVAEAARRAAGAVGKQAAEAGEGGGRGAELAYIIYTSGSTGQPKGVRMSHAGAVNTIAAINREFAVGAQDRVLGMSELNFDLSVYDLFGVLGAGGALVLGSAESRRDPGAWARLMRKYEVSVWNSVPALMEMQTQWLEANGEDLPEGVRVVLLSGDWINVSLPERIKKLSGRGDLEVVSLGGATEAGIWSIMHRIEEVRAEWRSIPYGKPLANQRIYVLNERGEEVPEEVLGELYIGGAGVAQGYQANEEQTRARFVESEWGERVYRTGDLGRYKREGWVEFVGREDTQVKIQGHRIELGEIESALIEHEAVKEAVVTAIGAHASPKRLVAYVTLQSPSNEQNIKVNKTNVISDKGAIVDMQEREAFKKQQPGIRKDLAQMPKIELDFSIDSGRLSNVYFDRRSHREFLNKPIEFKRFSNFLSCLRGARANGHPKYRYSSSGSLYPIQTYIYLKPDAVEKLDAGLYYYHPQFHQLISLNNEIRLTEAIHWLANRKAFRESAFSIFLVGDMDAITPMYGAAAKNFMLLEAGVMTHLLETEAADFEMGLCQIGSLDFDAIKDSFNFNDSSILLHSLVGGLAVPFEHGQIEFYEADAVDHTSAAYDHSNNGFEKNVNQAACSKSDLQEFLRKKLPEAYVPNAFVFLDKLPISSNGKVDRKSLPAPEDEGNLRNENVYIAPQNDLQKTIAEILSDELGIETVGIKDNFFDVGANSLHLIKVHTRIKNHLGIDFPVITLFRNSTVESLANNLETLEGVTETENDSTERALKQREMLNRRRIRATLEDTE